MDSVKGVTAANIATLPVIMWTFGEWSPVSPVANLLIGPVMTVTFPATYALAAVSLAAPSVAPWVAWIPGTGLHLTLTIVDQLAPIMPLIQLSVHRSSMAILVAMPCFAAIALMSRDGAQWSGILARRWRFEPLPLTVIASGVVCGGVMAVLASAIVW